MSKPSSNFHLLSSKQPKVAIIHDWMLSGGAEKVVEQLLTLYPDAPLYTSCINKQWQDKLRDRTVRTGYLNGWLFVKLRKFLPLLRMHWFRSLDLSEYSIIISSSGAEAKAVKTRPDQLHISYIHAPTHYYWSRYESYLESPGFGLLNPLARFGLKLLVRPMRKWDFRVAQDPDLLIASSTNIQKQIKKYYRRKSVVIHPPVDTARFKPRTKNQKPRIGLVIAGRQVPYKRFDLAIKACNKLRKPLIVIGNGPEHRKLVKIAGPTITFIKQALGSEIVSSFQKAEAFIFPGLDDFGITPVEAMAAGCPVIAYKAGGALDYVLEKESGIFFDAQTPASLIKALQKLPRVSFDSRVISKHAESFSVEKFNNSMRAFVEKAAERSFK